MYLKKLQSIANHVLCAKIFFENHAACEIMWKIL